MRGSGVIQRMGAFIRAAAGFSLVAALARYSSSEAQHILTAPDYEPLVRIGSGGGGGSGYGHTARHGGALKYQKWKRRRASGLR